MTGKGRTSLIVGRFQPLHKGHMDMIVKCSKESEELIIGIGSAQYSFLPENPFSSEERRAMLEGALEDEGIDNCRIVPIEDINRHSEWVAYVVSLVPPFDCAYSNNPLTVQLFEEAGYEVRNSPWCNKEEYSGTEVRRRMQSGEEWRQLVPDNVAELIDRIDGADRMRKIAEGYYASHRSRQVDRSSKI